MLIESTLNRMAPRKAGGGGGKKIPAAELQQGQRFANLTFEAHPVQIYPEVPSDASYIVAGSEVHLLNNARQVIGAIDPGHGKIVHVIKSERHLYVVYPQRIIQVLLADCRDQRVVFSTVPRLVLVRYSSAMDALFVLDIEDNLRIVDVNSATAAGEEDEEDGEGKSMTSVQGIVNFGVHPSGPWMCACTADAAISLYYFTSMNKVKGINKVAEIEGHWQVFVKEISYLQDAAYYQLSDGSSYRIPFDADKVMEEIGQARPSKQGRPRLDKGEVPKKEDVVKRPRGRPRKNPLPQTTSDQNSQSTTSEFNSDAILTNNEGRPKRAATRNKVYTQHVADSDEDESAYESEFESNNVENDE